nr:putative integron gene cassette protein [uncultured bacterium]
MEEREAKPQKPHHGNVEPELAWAKSLARATGDDVLVKYVHTAHEDCPEAECREGHEQNDPHCHHTPELRLCFVMPNA